MNRTKQLQQLVQAQQELLNWAGDTGRGRTNAAGLLVRKRILIPTLTIILVLVAHPIFTGSAESPEHDRIVAYIAEKNPAVSYIERHRIASAVLRESRSMHIPAGMAIDGQPVHPAYFLASIIAVESSFQREAVSKADARGYTQVMPDTVAWMRGERMTRAQLFDTDTNIRLGADYLSYLFSQFKSTRKVSLAYNAGPGNVRRGTYVERYWQKVRTHYLELAFNVQVAAR